MIDLGSSNRLIFYHYELHEDKICPTYHLTNPREFFRDTFVHFSKRFCAKWLWLSILSMHFVGRQLFQNLIKSLWTMICCPTKVVNLSTYKILLTKSLEKYVTLRKDTHLVETLGHLDVQFWRWGKIIFWISLQIGLVLCVVRLIELMIDVVDRQSVFP